MIKMRGLEQREDSPAGKPEKVDHELYYIRDGIIIIPKRHHPHGT